MPEVVLPARVLLVVAVLAAVVGAKRGETLLHVRVVVVDELAHRVHQVVMLTGARVPAAAPRRVCGSVDRAP